MSQIMEFIKVRNRIQSTLEKLPPGKLEIALAFLEFLEKTGEDMGQLGDEELWKVAKEPLSEQQWTRHQKLLARNEEGMLTDKERSDLEHLRTATDRFVFRRSYALALLKCRGHAVFPATDLSS